jgi:hypothetical protein
MSVKGEVDFLDAVPLGKRPKRGFRAGRAAAEQDAIGWVHTLDMINGVGRHLLRTLRFC